MKKPISFILSAAFFFLLLPVHFAYAGVGPMLKVDNENCSSYDTQPINITAGDTYCYEATFDESTGTEDLQIQLPANTFWYEGLGGLNSSDPNGATQGVTNLLQWDNVGVGPPFIYQFRVTTNASVGSATTQLTVDNDGDGVYDNGFSADIAVNVVTAPLANSATYLDNDANGKLDQVKIVFSKGIEGTTDGTGFAIAQGSCSAARTISGGVLSTTSVANDTLTLTFAECSLSDSGELPNLTYVSATGDISDGTTDLADIANGDLTETDGATPIRTSGSSLTIANNGNVIVEFSEQVTVPVDAATLTCGGSDVSGVISRISSNGTNNALEFNPDSNLTEDSCTLAIVANKVEDNAGYYATAENIAITVTGIDNLAPSGSSITSGNCANTGICIDAGDSATKLTAVNLTLAATDNSGTVTQMYIDGDVVDDANTKEWISYSTSKAVTLTTSDTIKNVTVAYRDTAGNMSGNYSDAIALDTQAPITGINLGGGTYVAQQNVILSTETGGTIYSAQVAGGASCPSTASLANYAGNGTVGLIGAVSPGTKLCYFSIDEADNREAVQSEIYITDGSVPAVVVNTIADQYLATGESTTISFTATDAGGLSGNPNYWIEEGGSGVQGSGDNLDLGQAVSAVLETSVAILASNAVLAEGANTLYIYVIDGANNTGSTSLTLYKDTTNPTGSSISIEGGASAVEGNSVDLTLFANDAGTGIAEMYIDGDVVDDANTKEWVAYATSKTVTLSGSAGSKTVTVQYRDQAGNTGATVSDSINYVATCSSGYHFDGMSCVSDTVSCTITNGTGQQTWSGGTWGSCTVVSCNSGYTIEGNTCHIASQSCSISNGVGQQDWSGGSWGTCYATSCNANYEISGTTCAAITDGGSGGGGGGGGAMINTTTIYKLPQSESDKLVDVFRPVQLSDNKFTRPVRIENYYKHSFVEIELGTEVQDLDGEPLIDFVVYQPTKVKSGTAWDDLGVPQPNKTLVSSYYYQFGDLGEKYSKPVKLTFPIYASIVKLDPASILIQKWVPQGLSANVSSALVVATTGTVTALDGNWETIGDGNLINAENDLVVETDYSTVYAIVSSNGEVLELTENTEPYGNTPFIDIGNHWAKDYIAELYEKKIVKGKSEDLFAPDDQATRAELTKIALNSFGYKVDSEAKPVEKTFLDVEVDAWFAPYVQEARDANIVNGYADGTFKPNSAINRAEALKILIEAAGIDVTGEKATFIDTSDEDWFAEYLAYAKNKGIVEGYPVGIEVPSMDNGEIKTVTQYYFRPAQFITRAEIAKIALKIMEIKDSL